MRLTSEQRQVLAALAGGAALKVHRSLDGDKLYRLHPLDDSAAQPVHEGAIVGLLQQGMLESNMKFPSATFLLTDKGLATAQRLSTNAATPVSIRTNEYLSIFS